MKFKNKTILITGGTGSFGSTVLRRFNDTDIGEIRILSRDEKKQDDLRRKYPDTKIKFYLGDVRDRDSIKSAFEEVNYIFHAAALKQVPSCEFFPLEAVKTNVIGTDNVLQCAIDNSVEKVVCLSTDKAVYPINAMGTSKAMMEKIIVAKSRNSKNTKICLTRYGNVMASRGSVIPLFVEQIKNKGEVTVTDPSMTRFMMSLDDAFKLVLFAFENGNNGDIFVQKSPASTIETLSKALFEILGKEEKIKEIGIRHGEKNHEVLLSREERFVSEDMGDYFRVPPDTRTLNYEQYFSKGRDLKSIEEYSSENTDRLSADQLKEILSNLPELQGHI
tara:strand:+ start:6452 stop:7450 length:999 start_codon:yes stop_codon:yes gene_type:complete